MLKHTLTGCALLVAASFSQAVEAPKVPIHLPTPKAGQYVHQAPTLADLEASNLHPELKAVIRRGYDLFMNTQQLRGRHVFNEMSCKSCHMGEGRKLWSGPIWPAATTLPDYRGKNQHVNSLEERIAGCFSFSMNGTPPAYGSDDMLALTAYHQWLAKSAPVYEKNLAGRGFSDLEKPAQTPDYQRGQAVYAQACALCHGADGQGQKVAGKVVYPPLWGDYSYNWGAGMTRIFTSATFIHRNMPLSQPGRLSVQEAWDVALYINSQERPQDPRYTGDAQETRQKYFNFHKHTRYGTEHEGRILGQHSNTGEKPFLKPEVLRPRTFNATPTPDA
ncbi:thiosulfate dehydrogenase [Allopseudospirillum japonicum]|uniref:Thiosulfate dehydrogenase n=1 Tax=Allopseudospirillum japonicum TaxID=64971 RepID=A0A1H6SSX2_9GAMM|nr:c-type cytochrome [Allopseudospirillum japonicum]SEI71019.1 thiosulfate dehydrogenase [Allopseudospirillum japonicum]